MLSLNSTPFRPRWGVASGHLQTVAGAYFPFASREHQATPLEVALTDGDRLIVHEDRPEPWRAGGRVVLLVHGLGGSHRSGHILRIADKLERAGYMVLRMDQRGWGASQAISRGHTHAGRSDDVQDVVRFAEARHPGSPISVIGFSLGGNIVLKWLGEQGGDLSAAVDSAAAVAPPIDLSHSAVNIRRWANRIYDRTFCRALNRLIQERRDDLLQVAPALDLRPARNLYDFDDRITARLAGFRDAEHYYRESSSFPLVERIEIPTLVLTAQDDPLIPFAMFEQARWPAVVAQLYPTSGGHLGFVARNGLDPDPFWLDWRILEWIQAQT